MKNILKHMEKKPEKEKLKFIWSFTIFFMIGAFSLWLNNVSRNFANLKDESVGNANLPEFPQEASEGISTAAQEGQKIADSYEETKKQAVISACNKYISDKKMSDDGFSSLQATDAKRENDGSYIVAYSHYYKGVLVVGSGIELSVNPETGSVSEKNNILKQVSGIETDPALSSKDAAQIASESLEGQEYAYKEANLAIVQQEEKFYLVWKTIFQSENGNMKAIYVGAKHGGIVDPLMAEVGSQLKNVTE